MIVNDPTVTLVPLSSIRRRRRGAQVVEKPHRRLERTLTGRYSAPPPEQELSPQVSGVTRGTLCHA